MHYYVSYALFSQNFHICYPFFQVPVTLVDKQHARCGLCNAVVSLNRKFEVIHLVRHFNAWHPSAHRCAGTWKNKVFFLPNLYPYFKYKILLTQLCNFSSHKLVWENHYPCKILRSLIPLSTMEIIYSAYGVECSCQSKHLRCIFPKFIPTTLKCPNAIYASRFLSLINYFKIFKWFISFSLIKSIFNFSKYLMIYILRNWLLMLDYLKNITRISL